MDHGAAQDISQDRYPKADAVLMKPFAFEDLLSMINLGLSKRRAENDMSV